MIRSKPEKKRSTLIRVKTAIPHRDWDQQGGDESVVLNYLVYVSCYEGSDHFPTMVVYFNFLCLHL